MIVPDEGYSKKISPRKLEIYFFIDTSKEMDDLLNLEHFSQNKHN